MCKWRDNGGDAGCVHVAGEGDPSATLAIHDLEIHNSAELSRALHIDWPSDALVIKPSIVIERLRITVPDQPDVSRVYAVSIIGKNQYVVGSSNELVCSGAARACQAWMCYAAGNCKLYHNHIVMEQNTTDENGRALLFDGHTQYGEAWNNRIVVNNNRAVRIRDSRNIRVHHNAFSDITPEQNALAALHVGDPDGAQPNDMESSVDQNRFLSRGGAILFARGATNFRFADNVIECTPRCAPGSLARIRGPIKSELIFSRNSLIRLDQPAIMDGPNTKVILCESGNAAGDGILVNSCSSTRGDDQRDAQRSR
jgi:hypothetical protein